MVVIRGSTSADPKEQIREMATILRGGDEEDEY
jgi:hypothetical protein